MIERRPKLGAECTAQGLTAQQSEPYTTGTPVWTQFTNYDGAGRLTRKVV